MSCLGDIPINSQAQLFPSGPFRGRDGKLKAATFIAAYWRMKSIREKFLTLRKSTVVIQRFFRKKLLQLNLEKKIAERNNRILDDFDKRQARFGKHYRTIKEQKRI